MNAARRTHTDTPVRVGRTWLFADGTRLPVVAGADDDGAVVVPEDLSTATADDLAALEAQLVAAFDSHLDDGSTDVAAMTEIAEALDRVRGEQTARAEADAQAAETIEALRNRVHAEAPAADLDPDPDADPEDATDAAEEPVLVAAAPPARRLPASASRTAARSARPAVPEGPRITITAAADIPGIAAGATIDLRRVATAMHDKARALSNGSPRVPIATFNIPFDNANRITVGMSKEAALDVMDATANPARLGNLVASGGWCVPSANLYDLFAIDGATGLLDVPQVNVERGGLNVPSYIGIDAADGALFEWSEDQDSATTLTITDLDATGGTATVTTDDDHLLAVGDLVNIVTGTAADGPYTVASITDGDTFTYATVGSPTVSNATGYATRQKSCFHIPCPTWTDYRLKAYGLCLEHGNLTDRAFPELTRRYVSLVMSAHQRRISAQHVATMEASANATAVTVTAAGTDSYGELMSAIELQAADYRSEHLMSDGTILEVPLPSWTREMLRSNLAMRAGVDLLAVTNDQLDAHLAVRRVRAQFVEDYQPLFSSTPKQVWPTSMRFLMYPAGGFVEGNGGTIDLGVQRDSTLNKTNDHTVAWTEDFRVLARRGPKARKATVTLSTDGVTACCS